MNEFTATEVWTVAGVGFGSALLGAVVGFSGSLFLTNRADEQRRRGVVLALLGELTTNSTLALMCALPMERAAQYSKAVWDDGKFEIARFASRDLFGLLLGIYSSIWIVEYASEQVGRGDSSQVDTIEGWYEVVRKAHSRLLLEAEASVTAGWNEMKSFQAELAELRSRYGKKSQQQDSEATRP